MKYSYKPYKPSTVCMRYSYKPYKPSTVCMRYPYKPYKPSTVCIRYSYKPYKPSTVCMSYPYKPYKLDPVCIGNRTHARNRKLFWWQSPGLYGWFVWSVETWHTNHTNRPQFVWESSYKPSPGNFFDEKLEIFMIGCPTGNPSKKIPV